MKIVKWCIVVGVILLIAQTAFALRAFFDYRVFYLPDHGTYIECVTSFEGKTLAIAPADSGWFQSSVELTLVISQDQKIIDFKKSHLKGPLIHEKQPVDFMSVERFSLHNGMYSIEIQLRDEVSGKTETLHQSIEIDNPAEGIFISDIEFVSAYAPTVEQNAFSKSGWDIIPYLSSFFPPSLDVLIYYAEMYRTDDILGAGAPFVSVISVVDTNHQEWESCRKIKREKSAPVVVAFQAIDISRLPSGEYTLRIEVRDRENKIIAYRERKFSRDHTIGTDQQNGYSISDTTWDDVVKKSFAARYTQRDSLYQIIQSHLPIAKNVERNTIDFQLSAADLTMLQSFFYSFWYNRNPADPESGWRNYEKELAVVESNFGTKIKRGWQTDRGRVYLQYGPPNTRVVRNHDPDYWPFEIWHYYETNRHLHNKRFLFYNTSLSTDMELLHSDVPDEIQNYDWKNLVRSRRMNDPATTGRLIQNPRQDPYSGDELESLWYNPH